MIKHWTPLVTLLITCVACGKKVKQQDEQLYSRHLQRMVKLTVVFTPPPEDRSTFNLLFLNDGQDMDKLRVKQIVDSLYELKAIQPLIVMGIHAGDRMQDYGVTEKPDFEGRGSRAHFYDAFIMNELFKYVQRQAETKQFNSVGIAGASLGGLSAFDIGWNHADKIDLVGVFSGSFWWRDKDLADSSYSDDRNRIILTKLKMSRKKSNQQYWFYAGGAEETSDRDKDGVIDVIDDTRDVIQLLQEKRGVPATNIKHVEKRDGVHDWKDWMKVFPDFLTWAFGNKK